jgi:GT2 family glycosyltransferase/glycosyltransferase involved in cell wall biosynthesis
VTASRTPSASPTPKPAPPSATSPASAFEGPTRRAASPSCSVILHAHRWPDAQTTARLHARLREAWPDAELIDAREQPAAALGAAAVINQAVTQARGAVIIALEPNRLPTVDSLIALAAAARDGLAVEASRSPLADERRTSHSSNTLLAELSEILQALGDANSPSLARGATEADDARVPAFAIARTHWDALGGLDSRLWSIGIVDDLASRAALAGIAVHAVAVETGSLPGGRSASADSARARGAAGSDSSGRDIAPGGGEGRDERPGVGTANADTSALSQWPAWPLRRNVARLLRTRNRLVTAFKTASPDALGHTFACEAARAVLESWRATGLTEDTFRFGGSFGRRGSDASALRDPAGVLLPLLALDAALDLLEPLEPERARWQALADARSTKPERDRLAVDEARAAEAAPANAHGSEATAVAAQPALVVASSSSPAAQPFVSVVIVNWNGKTHLRDCFGSLAASDYPRDRFELICVDNGSTDGSVDLLRAEFPDVRIVSLETNRGFTGGNEAGVAAARGGVLVFLNNDMRVEPDCLRELVARLSVGTAGAGTACAGARVLSWDGRYIDFIRGSLNFEARGFQDFYAVRNTTELSTPADTFFPNGGAFAVTREAYDRAGGFDPAFFAYYDDVDLGWRLRLIGVEPRVAGRAVVYHRHGATSRTQPKGQKRFLMDRNAVWTMMKNYGEPALRRTFGPALALAVRRLLDEGDVDRQADALRGLAPFVARLRRARTTSWPADDVYDSHASRPGAQANTAVGDAGRGIGRGRSPIRSLPIESLAAAGVALEALPRIVEERARTQAARRVPDAAILPHFGRGLESTSALASYKRIQHALMHALDLPSSFRPRTRLLIISNEAIARNMSGPAARALEIGRALAADCRVTIATPGAVEIEDARVTMASYDPKSQDSLRRLAEDADVALIQGFALTLYPFLKTLPLPIVADIYCPFTIEHLEMTRARMLDAGDVKSPASIALQHEAAGVLAGQNEPLRDADFFICASETQRDFWIGTLHSQGRINPLTYGDDPTLRRLIDVVPFGLPGEDIRDAARLAEETAAASGDAAAGPVMKGIWPGIGANDRVLLWAGSMLDWQDPLTLIEAVGELARTRDDVKLVFMGTRHPNPLVAPMRMVAESRALAERRGLLDRHVFFNDWVPYAQRARFLQEADLGLSTHLDHLETHFSFRTRMLDYVWAALPIVCTRGDFFAGLVEQRGLGRVVPPGDAQALASAMAVMLDDVRAREETKANLVRLREELTWARVVEPLRRFCAQPRLAADRSPQLLAFRARLERQFRGSKWAKRTALRLGVSERSIEKLKQSPLVRAVMVTRNHLAIRRARRG